MKLDLPMISELSSIKQAIQRYIFMTSVYGWLTVGLIIASKKKLLHETQTEKILDIIFNGGLDGEFFVIVLVSIVFTKGIYSFAPVENSTAFACEAIGGIFLTLGQMGSCLSVLYSVLFNGPWWHIVIAIWIWIFFGFIGIILSDLKLLIMLFNKT
jgi:hypothetical protein